MNRMLRVLLAMAFATLVAASVQAQINNNPPGGSGPTGRGRGPGVEASVVTNVRSPEVNADNTITFRLPAPNAQKVSGTRLSAIAIARKAKKRTPCDVAQGYMCPPAAE